MLDDLVMEPETRSLLLDAIIGYILDAEDLLKQNILSVEDTNQIRELLAEFKICHEQLMFIGGKSKDETRRLSRLLLKQKKESKSE